MKYITLIVLTITLLSACSTNDIEIENSFVVYAPHPIEFIDPIVAEFENETGISVKVIRAGTGELLSRIEHESETNEPVGDVLWGGSLASLESKKTLFHEYVSVNEEALRYKNSDGFITRFTMIPSVIMVNENLIGDIEIEGYEDLLVDELRGKVAFANPKFSASSYEQLLNQLWAMGSGNPNNGWNYIEELIPILDGNLLDSSSKVYDGVAKGEYIVGLTFEEAAAKYIANGAPIRIIYPNEGTIIRPDGVSIIKTTDNLDAAKAFVDFVTSYDIQLFISTELNRRATRVDVPKSESLKAYEEINIITDDQSWSSENKDNVINRFLQLFEEAN